MSSRGSGYILAHPEREASLSHPRTAILVPLLLMVAAACGHTRVITGEGQGNSAAGLGSGANGGTAPPVEGVDLVPIHIPEWVFGVPTSTPQIQAPSHALAAVTPDTGRLQISALPSPAGTTAVDLIEQSTPRQRWGDVMIPAERLMFATFAANRSLGEWLVIVDDVKVVGGPDPIPTTAYRWRRADVEAYARCGIPPLFVIETCTNAFYALPEMHLVTRGFHLAGA